MEGIIVFLVLLLVGYLAGSAAESSHFKSLNRREKLMAGLPVCNLKYPPAPYTAARSGLVTGSVVISVDYFKMVAATLRSLVGGHIGAYQSLMERGRREALLRLQEMAHEQGYTAVMGVQFATTRLASPGQDNKGVMGLEFIAYGTGVTRAPDA